MPILSWMLRLRRVDYGSVLDICRFQGCSRQAYYAYRQRLAQAALEAEVVLDLVRCQRQRLPRLGGRKLLYKIGPELIKSGIDMGRDDFFKLLKDNDLLVKKPRRKCKTTQSNHPFRIYENLFAQLQVEHIFQAIVADITYIDTCEGFLYLALLTDVRSRKVVGYDISDSLELEGCKRALLAALRLMPAALRKAKAPYQVHHHSDRGVQYCSNEYTRLLRTNHIAISMAATGNCYENALAERVNGIFKDEFELGQQLPSKAIAKKIVHQAIPIFNHERPHTSLQFLTPEQVFVNELNTFKIKHFV